MDQELKQQFEKMDKRFEAIIQNMVTKTEMEQGLASLRAELANKADIERLYNAVDAYAKQSRDYHQEVTVLLAKVHRIESWIKEAAPKLGIKYNV